MSLFKMNVLNFLVGILFSSSSFAAGNSFCHYLFIDGGYAVQESSDIYIYENSEKNQLVAIVKIDQASDNSLKINNILDHKGTNIGTTETDLASLTGILLNTGSFGRPTSCKNVAVLSAKKQGQITFKKEMDPKTL